MRIGLTLGVAAAIQLTASIAGAEPEKLRVGKQYGLAFLPLMVMEAEDLYSAHAKELGIQTSVEWLTLGGPAASNEALLSGNADIIANGPPAFLIMWDKTRGTPLQVKGIGSVVSQSMYLNTRNPDVKTIEDLSEKDRIALSSVKTSIAAIILQMAAAREWGPDNYNHLDDLTVSMPHPDGLNALVSGGTEITAHFTAPPYQSIELKSPDVHTILTSADVMGGLSTAAVMFSTDKFYAENPKAIQAFVGALRDAQVLISQHPDKAADIYLSMAKEGGLAKADIVELLKDPSIKFTPEPQQIMTYAKFLKQVGTLNNVPADWKEVFIDLVHDQNGS
jgi:NitT/TauT family transport system substrate-binding protein